MHNFKQSHNYNNIHELLLIQEFLCDLVMPAMRCSELEQIGEEVFCTSLFLGSLAVVQDGRCQLAHCPLLPTKVGSHLSNLKPVIDNTCKYS